MTPTWTENRIATLRRMWGEGASASAIARDLGGVTRVAVLGKVHRLGLSEPRAKTAALKPQAKPKRKILCAVQGCGKVLGKSNQSGVCGDHTHVAPYCVCPKCRGEALTRRAAPVARDHVQTALVPTTGVVTSGGGGHIAVSLPREPWLPA
jgi:hypothetical protein